MKRQHHIVLIRDWLVHAKTIITTLVVAVVLGGCFFQNQMMSFTTRYGRDAEIYRGKAKVNSLRRRSAVAKKRQDYKKVALRKAERERSLPATVKMDGAAAKESTREDNGATVPPLPQRVSELRAPALHKPKAPQNEPTTAAYGSH